MTGFNEATHGHVIAVYGPPKYKLWSVGCRCGWSQLRPKVERIQGGKTKKVLLPMKEFRGLGDKHLYDVWQDSLQTRLDV